MAAHVDGSAQRAGARIAALVNRIGWPLLVVLAGTLVRLAYGLVVNDPMSGPDAETYEGAARGLATEGWFAEIPNLIDRHAGYSAMIAAVYEIAGTAPRAFIAVQAVLVGVGCWAAYTLAARELSPTVGLVALVLVTINPAVLASSTEIMYEPLLGTFLVIGVDLFSRARHASRTRSSWGLMAGAGLSFGVATTCHPKALPVGLAMGLWWLLAARPRLAVLGLVVALAVPPLATTGRDAIATGGSFAFAEHVGLTMFSFRAVNTGDAPPATLGSDPAAERTENVSSAEGLLTVTWDKARELWHPMTPPASTGHGSWFHRLTPGRVVEGRASLEPVVRAGQYVIAVGSALLTIAGLVLLALRRRWHALVLIGLPVLGFLAVSLVTIAEGRFRLPIVPFAAILQAVAITAALPALRRSVSRRAGTR